MKFLLDTNILLVPGKFGVDIFSELEKFGKPEIHVLDLSIREIRKIVKGGGRDSRHALLALDIIEKKGIKIMETGLAEHTDRVIMRFARQGYVVCTSDRPLIRKLRDRGFKVITLRQGKYLVQV